VIDLAYDWDRKHRYIDIDKENKEKVNCKYIGTTGEKFERFKKS
jgi:hypothetical protein